MEMIKDNMLNKKEEMEELKIKFLKENVGNVFYFSEVDYQTNNPFDGETNHCISCLYVYIYEDGGEVLTKHITRSSRSGYSDGYADLRNVIHETVYDKVVSGIKNFDYLDKLIENGVMIKELPEEIDYLINNVDNYNLSNGCAFAVSDDDSLEDRMKRIKYFIEIKKYVDSK